jgi:hypothetical protein
LSSPGGRAGRRVFRVLVDGELAQFIDVLQAEHLLLEHLRRAVKGDRFG